MTAPSKPKRRPKAPTKFWWFDGESKAELTRQLLNTPGGRLEVHLAGDKMTFEVVGPESVTASVTRNPPINESHVCPPQCP